MGAVVGTLLGVTALGAVAYYLYRRAKLAPKHLSIRAGSLLMSETEEAMLFGNEDAINNAGADYEVTENMTL